jgi:hypothetical protein
VHPLRRYAARSAARSTRASSPRSALLPAGLVVLLAFAAPAAGQTDAAPTLDAYRRGREVVEGALRAYVAEGAAIVTTPGNRAFLEALACAPATLAPDRLSRAPRPAKVEAIAGKRRTFRDGERTVELFDIGPTLLQGDLLNAGGDLSLRPGNETTAHFARWLRASGLRVRSILGVHSRARTPAELEQAGRMSADGR